MIIRHRIFALAGLWAVLGLLAPAQAQSQVASPAANAPALDNAGSAKTAAKPRRRAAKPANTTRAARTRRPADLGAAQSQPFPKGFVPPEFNRDSDDGPSVRPALTPGGAMGIGGRF